MENAVDTHVGFKSIEKINAAIHWFDEFLLSISTLLLGIALMLAIADVGTNGIIFRNPLLLIGWSVATGIGIESQLRTLVRRAKLAYKVDNWAFVMWVFLAIIIFAVSAVALVIFNTEKMLGLSENQALAMAHIDPYWYALGRAILSVTLVVISGFAYYKRSIARPDTETEIAQLKHKQAVLPLQMQVDALEAQRRQQQDVHNVRRGVGLVKTAVNEVRAPKEQELPLVAAKYERVVDADDPTDDGDDDPTPPTSPRGPRRGSRNPGSDMALVPAGPRNPGTRGRPATAKVFVPEIVAGMEYARPTGPLGSMRVDAAKEIIAGAEREMTLAELAKAVNTAVGGESSLSAPNASKIRTIAFQELARDGQLPSWAEKFVVRTAA